MHLSRPKWLLTIMSAQWEWKFTPQIIVSAINLLLMGVGVVGIFIKMQADVSNAREAVTELKQIVVTMKEGQNLTSERLIRLETQVGIILPAVKRIEMNQR